jgi:hypothetical protein
MRAARRFDRQPEHIPQFVAATPRTEAGPIPSSRSHQAQTCIGLPFRRRTVQPPRPVCQAVFSGCWTVECARRSPGVQAEDAGRMG